MGPGGDRPADGTEEGLGEPAVGELPRLGPTIPDVGTFLIPVIGIAVPVILAAALLVLQAAGGIAGIRLAHRSLERTASLVPRWMRG